MADVGIDVGTRLQVQSCSSLWIGIGGAVRMGIGGGICVERTRAPGRRVRATGRLEGTAEVCRDRVAATSIG